MFSLYFLTFVVFMSFTQAENILYPPYTCTTTTTFCRPGQHTTTVPPSRERSRKRGMVGLPGIKGEKGDSCQCDVTDREVLEELRREMQDLKTQNRGIMRQMAELATENQQIKQEIEHLTAWNSSKTEIAQEEAAVEPTTTESTTAVRTGSTFHRGNCDVTYNSKCFKTVVYATHNVTFEYAQSICDEINSEPANIHDVSHYRLLEENLRLKMPDLVRTWVEVWTGMKCHNNQLKLRSGENSFLPAEVWYPGYPDEDVANRNNIGITVNMDPDNNYEGIWNAQPSWKNYGVICEN